MLVTYIYSVLLDDCVHDDANQRVEEHSTPVLPAGLVRVSDATGIWFNSVKISKLYAIKYEIRNVLTVESPGWDRHRSDCGAGQ